MVFSHPVLFVESGAELLFELGHAMGGGVLIGTLAGSIMG